MLPYDKKDNDSDKPDAQPNMIQKVLKVLAWPISAATGVIFAHKYARNATYDILKSHGDFDHLQEKMDQDFKKLNDTAEVKTTVVVIEGGKPVEKTIGKIAGSVKKAIHDDYSRGVDEILATRGYKKYNTYKYVKDLSGIQQREALVAFLGPAAVAMGVTLTIADSKVLEKLTNRSHRQPDTQAQAPR